MELIKTSLRLPRELWRAAHIRAMDEHRDLQDVVADALALYLRRSTKEGAAR
jgi:hypothetical protein